MEECRGCPPGHWLGAYYWLIVNTKSFFSSGLTSLQRIGMVLWPLCLFNCGDGAVRRALCFSLPYSREITHF
jgi:hypothetical protein